MKLRILTVVVLAGVMALVGLGWLIEAVQTLRTRIRIARREVDAVVTGDHPDGVEMYAPAPLPAWLDTDPEFPACPDSPDELHAFWQSNPSV